MQIGIIGGGRLGRALAARLVAAGHGVAFAAVPGAEDSARAAAEAVPGTTRDGVGAVVDAAEVVVLAVPYDAVGDALANAGDLGGRVLWSCVNALAPDASGLVVGFTTSGAEEVARAARGARTVAAVPPFADLLASGAVEIDGRPPTVFCCADDDAARGVVAGLVRDIGLEAADAGPLASARLVEPAMLLLVRLAYAGPAPRTLGLSLLGAGSGS